MKPLVVNQDILAGKWKQARGHVKQWWGKLTDNDVERINGRVEELIGSLQEAYGYTRQEAESEVDRFLEQFNQ
jgi:uncharacterized protein YjbJ (UPF0337 family)